MQQCTQCETYMQELNEQAPNHDRNTCMTEDCDLCFYELGGNICTHQEG